MVTRSIENFEGVVPEIGLDGDIIILMETLPLPAGSLAVAPHVQFRVCLESILVAEEIPGDEEPDLTRIREIAVAAESHFSFPSI